MTIERKIFDLKCEIEEWSRAAKRENQKVKLLKAPFRIARLQALKSPSRFRVGCVLARGGRIISTGHNDMDRTHPYVRQHSQFAHLHAEVACCLGIRPFDVRGCSAYIYRILMDGSPALARPCSMCREVLRRMGIKKVFYTTDKSPFFTCEEI